MVMCRKLRITIVSAKCLPETRLFGRMKIYAEVSIAGESNTGKKTPADLEGETNPTWNFDVDYVVRESAIQKAGVEVCIKLFCQRTFGRDGFIGEVNIPVKRLFDMGPKADRVLSCRVRGTHKGRLNIFYSFGKSVSVQKMEEPRRSEWKHAIEVGFLMLVEGAISVFADVVDDYVDGYGYDDDHVHEYGYDQEEDEDEDEEDGDYEDEDGESDVDVDEDDDDDEEEDEDDDEDEEW